MLWIQCTTGMSGLAAQYGGSSSVPIRSVLFKHSHAANHVTGRLLGE